MAQVHPHPDELDWLATPLDEGEVRVLEMLMRLNDDWFVYVQPQIGLERPDFVVAHPRLGITVVEVKDWRCRSTGWRTASSRSVTVTAGADDRGAATSGDRYRAALRSALEDVREAPELRDIRGVVVFPLERTSRARSLFWQAPTRGTERFVEVFGGTTSSTGRSTCSPVRVAPRPSVAVVVRSMRCVSCWPNPSGSATCACPSSSTRRRATSRRTRTARRVAG